MPETVLWTNTIGGNNHSLVYKDGVLTLTVIKSDGSKCICRANTNLSGEDWLAAFEGVGPEWATQYGVYQRADHFKAQRSVTCGSEKLIWSVDHKKVDGAYILNDELQVFILRR